MQIIDAFSTAAVTFYSLNSDKFANQEQAGGTVVIGWTIGGDVDIKAAGGNTTVILTEDEWLAGMKELTGYENTKDDLKNLKDAMSSAEGKTITKIVTKYNFGTSSNNETQLGPEVPAGAVGVQACKGDNFHDNKILEVSTSYIGSKQ